MKIVIIDYGAGNTKSVQFALNRCGIEPELTKNPDLIREADGVVFPGVGHAKYAVENLQKTELTEVISSLKQPFLGVCLGMQLMCKNTEEGDQKGLGIFDSEVVKFNDSLKVPQIGWNQVFTDTNPLFKGIAEGSYFYFVHSYFATIADCTAGTSDYGIKFSAALQKDNFFGCQFHPEKSGEAGELILKNFISLCK